MKLSTMNNSGSLRSRATRNAGLTIIELLVAIALGAILLSGAIQLFVNNRATYELTTDMARLQENARFALQTMVTDLRMAGHTGCINNDAVVKNNTAATVGQLADFSNGGLEGIDAGDPTWSPSGYDGGNFSPVTDPDPDIRFLPTADAITIRYLLGERVDSDGDTVLDMQVVNAVYSGNLGITVNNNNTGLAFTDVAGISDCGGVDVFTITAVGGNTITANTLSRAYGPINRAIVGRFIGVRYFLRNNPEGVPSLFRVGFDTTPGSLSSETPLANQEELVDGVQSMQILYGIDSDGDGVPNQFLAANAAGLQTRDDWLSVISVRISLLMRTANGIGRIVDNNIYQVGDVRFCRAGIAPAPNPACGVTWATDNFRRRVFQTTVSIRNL